MATNGAFDDFLDALLAFESGWDRERYESGQIADWQLDSWAGGAVGDFFPVYSSWADLTDAEWETMAYRSTNSLGFVGFQFGEALLIDLGYYEDDVYYGNGAATNTWDGTWTGKNGATSLEAFMTKEVQGEAILDAFGYNLSVIETGLAQSGESLNDYLGETFTYYENGTPVEVTLTLTGVLAAAHLRGAWGTLSLLQNGTVSTDEYGTSILKYVDQFGDYDAPTVETLIASYEAGEADDTGNGQGSGDDAGDDGDTGGDTGAGEGDAGDGGTVADAGDGFGTAGVSAATADVVINWAWGAEKVVSDFDPDSSTIFVAWIGADQLDVAETDAGVLFSIPSNEQSILLEGVSLSDLSEANFTFLDATAGNEVFAAIAAAGGSASGDGTDAGSGSGETDAGTGDVSGGGGSGDADTGDDGSADGGSGDGTDGGAGEGAGDGTGEGTGSDGGTVDPMVYAYSWNWGAREVVGDFDPATDQIDLSALWTSYESFTIGSDADGNAVIDLIDINNQTITLAGVDADALTAGNFLGVTGAWPGVAGGAGETGGPDDGDGSADGTQDGGVDAGEGVAVGLVLIDSWGDTFHFSATVANTGDATLEDWSFELDTDMELVSSWGVGVAESDDGYAMSNVDWNGDLAGGQSAQFGFIVSGDLDLLV